MEKALDLYKTTKTTIADAAAQLKIPAMTLHSRYGNYLFQFIFKCQLLIGKTIFVNGLQST